MPAHSHESDPLSAISRRGKRVVVPSSAASGTLSKRSMIIYAPLVPHPWSSGEAFAVRLPVVRGSGPACDLSSSSWSSRKRIGARDLLAARAAYFAPAVNWRLCRSTGAGIERRGCGGCPVAAGDHIVGEIDESTASWFGKGDHLVGRDLAWTRPRPAVVCGDALLSCNLGFPLGAHGDHARRSSQFWICGGYLTRKVRDSHRTNHAEMEAFQGRLHINAVSDLIWRGPTGCSAGGCIYRRSDLAGARLKTGSARRLGWLTRPIVWPVDSRRPEKHPTSR